MEQSASSVTWRRGALAKAGWMLAALAASLGLSGTPALAAEHPFLERFGSAAKPSFRNAMGMAVDQSTGDLLVIDLNAFAVSRYHADGTPSPFSALGTNVIDGKGGGECPTVPADCDQTPSNSLDGFGNLQDNQIAVDNSGTATDGNIYVTQVQRQLIEIFAKDGSFLGRLTKFEEGGEEKAFKELGGVTVDASGAVYVSDNLIHKYEPSANPPVTSDNVANFSSQAGKSPRALAAGAGPSAGFLFVNRLSGELFKLDSSSGEQKYKIGNFVDKHVAVSVDPTSGHVYATTGNAVKEYDASGATKATLAHTIPSCSPVQGVAVDETSGRVYLSRLGASAIAVYGPAVATAPTIGEPCSQDDAWTASAAVTEATLKAKINPNGLATTYRVEYGTDTSYGQSSPTQSVGSDEAVHTVSLTLSGLEPSTTYHWRVVATNSAGSKVGPDRTFTTHAPAEAAPPCPNAEFRIGPSALLPDCRAYEMVSPVDKAGSDIKWGTTLTGIPVARNQSNPTGEKLTYTTNRRFGDAVSQPYAPQYIASRHPGEGWSSHGISPPRGVIRGDSTAGTNNEFKVFSEDLCTAWLVTDNTTAPPLAPGGIEDANNLYRRTNCGAEGYEWLDADEFPQEVQGITADGTVVFRRGSQVFLKGEEGPVPICILPNDTQLSSGCSVGSAGINEYEHSLSHALSEDGSTIFWSQDGRIFVRENASQPQSKQLHGSARGTGDLVKGSAEVTNVATTSGTFAAGQSISGRGIPFGTTILAVGAGSLTLSAPASENRAASELSAHSECTEVEAGKACTLEVSESVSPGAFAPELTTQAAKFWGAAADGSRALFSFDPDEKEVANPGPAGPDLYEFEVASGTPTLIAHNTLGVLGASEDLSRIYLASKEVLDAAPNSEGNVAEAGKANLYLHERGGGFTFIATLSGSEPSAKNPLSIVPVGHAARVTPDGEVAAFTSTASLTGYDNSDAKSAAADLEVFRYEAGADELSCVSCNPSGARPAGQLVTELELRFGKYWAAAQLPGAQHALYFPRALSENGDRLFFESFDALVLRDTNQRKDVYQWQAVGEGGCTQEASAFKPNVEGCLNLISSGENERDSSFLDATPDGSDVFFTTEASLISSDPDLIDIYDARVGGGFAEPKPPPAPCEGEACQSPPPPPEEITPSSLLFQGPGDLPKKKARCPKGKRRVVRGGKARCVKKHRKGKRKRQNRAKSKSGRAQR